MTLSGRALPRTLGAASRFDLVEDHTSVPRDESRRSSVPAPSAAAATDGGTVERAVQTTASRSNAESGADQPLPDVPLPDAGTDVLGPALAAQAARDPRWPEALAQARWALRIGQRRRRPDGTVEDWVDPETRAELERRGRLRLAVYDAADAFVAREGRAPNKREQRQLVARVIVEEEETQQAWDAAAAAFAKGEPELARSHLRRVAAGGSHDAEDRLRRGMQLASTSPGESQLAVGAFSDDEPLDGEPAKEGARVLPRLAADGHPGIGGRYDEPDGHPGVGPEVPALLQNEAVEEELRVPDNLESLLKERLGDELYEQLWHDSVEGMAELIGIDPELARAAGPEAAAALAGVVTFRHFELPYQKNMVNQLIRRLGRAGHKELESKLFAKLAFQNSLGPDHERYSMSNQELLDANAWDARVLPYWRALDSLTGALPGGTLLGRMLPGLFVEGFKSNMAGRNRILRRRGVEVDEPAR